MLPLTEIANGNQGKTSLQVQITAIERQIQEQDDKDAAISRTREYWRLGGSLPPEEGRDVEHDNGEIRSFEWHEDALMDNLKRKLEHYGQYQFLKQRISRITRADQILLSYHRTRGLPLPPRHSRDSVSNWISGTSSLCRQAQKYIHLHRDFCSFNN
ncbi:hypothetical protein BPOR_1149g00010 [Botrytis porri]|uniref:Uncharacterized protein n=1 Tax=Botrytis porri TaxID=87229 RepID=A0A4Z1K714_9HELO|nr:hypothetical protein BPOR_1149g00010 [Botrytis porri]